MGVGVKVVCEGQSGKVSPLVNDPYHDDCAACMPYRVEENHMLLKCQRPQALVQLVTLATGLRVFCDALEGRRKLGKQLSHWSWPHRAKV